MKITSRCSICYVPTQQKIRPDVVTDTSGRNFRSILVIIKRASFASGSGVATGGNKVAIETPLIATRYSFIINELSASVANIALKWRKIIFLLKNSSFDVSWWNHVRHCASSYVSLSWRIRLNWVTDSTSLGGRFDFAGWWIRLRWVEEAISLAEWSTWCCRMKWLK